MNNQKKLEKAAINEIEFLVMGLILLFSNVALYFISGIMIRYLALLMGILFIFFAAYKRGRHHIPKLIPFFLFSLLYVSILAIISFFQKQVISYDIIKQLFAIIIVGCFFSGYLLSQSKIHFIENFKSWKVRGLTVVIVFALIGFLRYYESISYYGTMRGYGEDTALNPVGVAFTFTLLLLVYFVLTISSRNILDRVLYGLAMTLSMAIVVTTASRGAIVWAILTIIFLVLSSRIKKIKFSKFFILLLFVTLFSGFAFLFFAKNVILIESFEILIKRFSGLFGGYNPTASGLDISANARVEYWNHYASIFSDWILFGEKFYSGYPHNQYLEILVRFGLLGIPLLIFSLFVMGKFIYSFLFKKKERDFELTLISAIFLFGYLSSLTSLNLEMNRAMWLGLGYFFGCFYKSNL
jgi:O-antigen ligase